MPQTINTFQVSNHSAARPTSGPGLSVDFEIRGQWKTILDNSLILRGNPDSLQGLVNYLRGEIDEINSDIDVEISEEEFKLNNAPDKPKSTTYKFPRLGFTLAHKEGDDHIDIKITPADADGRNQFMSRWLARVVEKFNEKTRLLGDEFMRELRHKILMFDMDSMLNEAALCAKNELKVIASGGREMDFDSNERRVSYFKYEASNWAGIMKDVKAWAEIAIHGLNAEQNSFETLKFEVSDPQVTRLPSATDDQAQAIRVMRDQLMLDANTISQYYSVLAADFSQGG